MRFISLILCVVITSVATADSAYPPAGNRSADDGRLVWLGTCESCHAYGIAGAPNPSKPDDWAERLLKARSALYQNAISGFFGPGDTYMPPKGGNEQLTDEQVKSAVDYMLEFAIQNLQQQETKQ